MRSQSFACHSRSSFSPSIRLRNRIGGRVYACCGTRVARGTSRGWGGGTSVRVASLKVGQGAAGAIAQSASRRK